MRRTHVDSVASILGCKFRVDFVQNCLLVPQYQCNLHLHAGHDEHAMSTVVGKQEKNDKMFVFVIAQSEIFSFIFVTSGEK